MIKDVLKELPITTRQEGALQLRCQTHNKLIEFYLKITKAHRSDGNHYNLKVMRIKGDYMSYHRLARHVLESCQNVLRLHHISGFEADPTDSLKALQNKSDISLTALSEQSESMTSLVEGTNEGSFFLD